jgi:phage shock protein PspC (stress-responsive transcriptional regulator)
VVAGVCAGVGYRLGIDPNVVRVVAVVLAIFGGAGLLLYAIGWLLMPQQSTGTSLGERALRGGGPDGLTTVLLALALVVVAVGVGAVIVSDSGFALVVLLVAVTVGAVLLSRRPSAPARYAPVPAPGSPAGPPAPGVPPSYAAAPAMYAPPPMAMPGLAPAPPDAYGVPAQPAPRRPRSVLGPLTAFAALAATGVLGLVDALGASVPVSAYVATPLAVVGIGLVAGAWIGRSRGLIALGAVLVLMLVPVTTVERLDFADLADGQDGSVLVELSTAEEIAGVTFDHGVGDVRYDLSDLRLDGATVGTTVQLGAGTLVVVVPPDVTLQVSADAAAGQIDLLGETSDGVGASREATFAGDEGAGTLRLDVGVGLGSVEVDRAGA